jgi:hypothetical protein
MTAPCVLRCFLHMSGKRWVIHIASPSPWRNPLPFGILNRSRSEGVIVLELVLDFLFFQGTQAGSAIPPEPESPVSSQIFVVAP